MGFYTVASLVHDARHHGVEVRLPDLVLGDRLCTAEPATGTPDELALRVGWKLVRGIGERALDALVAARAERPFTSIADVVRRARLTRADANALARAHAFASFEPDRRRAGWEALRAVGDTLPLAPATPVAERPDGFAPPALGRIESVFADYYAIGLSTAGHPTERFRAWARRVGAIDTAQLAQARGGERVILIGLVTVRQRPQSAKGTVFLLLEDEHGSANVIVWPKLYEQYYETVAHAPFIAVYGEVTRDGGEVSLVGRRYKALGVEEATTETTVPTLTHHARDFR
jgi:error-prone DNA polymerase